MKGKDRDEPSSRALDQAATYGKRFRGTRRPLHPSASAAELRRRFDVGLPEAGRDPAAVLEDLIAAAEPGLVGNTDPRFFAWVMGSSTWRELPRTGSPRSGVRMRLSTRLPLSLPLWRR
jgi:hypothetical protein